MATKSEDAKTELRVHPEASDMASGQQKQDSHVSGQADDEASTAAKRRGSKDQCQVENCMANLTKEGKAYCVKRRLCIEHMRADTVKCRGQEGLFRFCFQCGKLEPISRFEGMKRSCRTRLAERKQREARRCTSDVAYRFSRSQQNLMKQQQHIAAQHTHSSSGLAQVPPDLHEELLPLQLHDIEYCEESAEADQQLQLLPMIYPAYMMAPARHLSGTSSLAPLAEESFCDVPLQAHLSDSNNAASAAALMSGVLHTQASFSSRSPAANGNSSCCNCAGHGAQQQQQQLIQTQQQLLQATLSMSQHNMAVNTAVGALSVPLPSVTGSAAHHTPSGCVSGPLPAWVGAGTSQGLSGLPAPQPSGLSGRQPGQAASTATQGPTASGCISAPLPSLMSEPVAPRHCMAAAAAQYQAADFGLDADLLHECFIQLSTDSNVGAEGLPYSDTDLRNLLEGALETAAQSSQQQLALPLPMQQPQLVPVLASCGWAAAATGQALSTSQIHMPPAVGGTEKPPTAPLRHLSLSAGQQQQFSADVPYEIASAATAPLPSIPGRRMSKAAVIEQLHRIQQEQMVLLQQLHMQEAASNGVAACAPGTVGSTVALTEDALQIRLQMVQQQYTQMLMEVQKMKQLNIMGLDPAAASCLQFEA